MMPPMDTYAAIKRGLEAEAEKLGKQILEADLSCEDYRTMRAERRGVLRAIEVAKRAYKQKLEDE